MPWDASATNLGFSSGTPWLPMAPAHRALAVSEQAPDPASTLAFARKFLKARKTSAALRLGEIEFLDAPAPILAFTRVKDDERVLCVFNMSANAAEFADRIITQTKPLDIGTGQGTAAGNKLKLGAYTAWFAEI
jgi:alpha-glucosidase